MSCQGCDQSLKLRHHPAEGQDVFCRECQNIANKGKPGSRLVRKGKTYDFETPCDQCGEPERTSFLPKKERPFLCNNCLKESRASETMQVQPPVQMESRPGPDEPDREPEPLITQDIQEKTVDSFWVKCPKCRKSLKMKFQPSSKRPFLCPVCYNKKQEALRSEKPDTKVFFNLECSDCGKQETLNFIPTFPDRALCGSCFEKMKRRKQ